MYCVKCGKQIDDDSNFCTGCGTRVKGSSAQTEQPTQQPESIKKVWKATNGNQREFTLCGHKLQVSANLDIFNTYRLEFRKLANDCSNCAREEYNIKVRDLLTYLQFTPNIYGNYLKIVCAKAVQILISDNIWNITEADMLNSHKEQYHLVIDDISVTFKSIELTIENNQRFVANITGLIPNLIGGGFGIKGAAKGIASATAFNIARDSVEVSMIKNAANLKAAQRTELYNRIRPSILFEHFFVDYWRVLLTLVDFLNQNNRNIWIPSNTDFKNAESIFSNLTNPNFPKEQLVSTLIKILLMNPYNKKYYQFMIDHLGDTEEVQVIRNYFGYTDLNNPRIT